MRLQSQAHLVMIGVEASGQIYKVDDDIVLKTGRIFEPPTANASSQDRWFYASETIFQSNLMKNEKFVMRLLHQHPHPNLVEVIDAGHPEGIYLRNYRRMWELDGAAPASRLQWYRDITDALAHLHKLGIAHADLRMENMVFDARGCAILCEFSASTPFGEPNHVFPDQPVPINGVAPTISDATDRFAMGSLIFQMEHGVKPGFVVGVGGSLILPEVRTGHPELDSVIRKAWLGQYSNTGEMLEQIESLKCGGRQSWDLHRKEPSRELLDERVLRWRECRMKQFGEHPSCLYISAP
jgi:serine/threonine protein kinase